MLQKFNAANKDILVNINGELIHRNDAGVSPFDSVVQGGDAVWEGLRVYAGRVYRLTPHLDRLVASAKALGFARIPGHDELREQLRRTLEANKMYDGVHVRLTLTRGIKVTSGMDPRLNTSGPTLIIIAEHKPPVYGSSGVRLITSGVRRIPPDCVDQKIHSCNLINSILAKIQANAAGVDDALMLDTRGYVAETNATHVFIVTNGELHTPTTGSCPEGITRASVLDLCARHGLTAHVRDLTITECYSCDEMFCTGTMGELVPVLELDGRPVGDGAAGELTDKLRRLYQELTAASGEPLVSGEFDG
ncbi:MAG: aminotransferase IV [Gammaproteobacteria bacterium]|nr:aminotransferase IV [Gammaproteobacteria bacterium]